MICFSSWFGINFIYIYVCVVGFWENQFLYMYYCFYIDEKLDWSILFLNMLFQNKKQDRILIDRLIRWFGNKYYLYLDIRFLVQIIFVIFWKYILNGPYIKIRGRKPVKDPSNLHGIDRRVFIEFPTKIL